MNNEQNRTTCRIAVVIPYYGKWSFFMPLFLLGCKNNPEIDFLFFTSLPPIEDAPGNVRFIPMELTEICRRLSVVTGLSVSFTTPYKLCDFKPMYGAAFSEFLTGYDYWCFGDVDLIYGRLMDFLRPITMKDYDVATFRRKWIAASFVLMKNTNTVNRLFQRSSALNELLTEKCVCFDELGANMINKHGFTKVCQEAENDGKIKLFRADLTEEGQHLRLMEYRDGRLFQDGKEYFILHFVCIKAPRYFHFPKWKNFPEHFFIDNTGFFSEKALRFRFFIRIYRFSAAIFESLRHNSIKTQLKRFGFSKKKKFENNGTVFK